MIHWNDNAEGSSSDYISSVADEYERVLDARINFLSAKVSALYYEWNQLQKLHCEEVNSIGQDVQRQIEITGRIGDLARLEKTFKVSAVNVLSVRAPVPSDFNIGSEHLMKTEDFNARGTDSQGSTNGSQKMQLAQNWRELLKGGDSVDQQEDEPSNLANYIGVAKQKRFKHSAEKDKQNHGGQEEGSTADFVD